MDQGFFDKSLVVLEKRYSDLFNLHQARLSANLADLEKERKERAAGAERVKVLEGELAGVKGERDVRAKEKGEAEKAAEELKQQLSAKGAELEKERKERAAGAERVKVLEGELAGVKGERDARAKEKDEAREEAELILLQLHQVQEELERCFLESRTQDDLLRQHQTQSQAIRQVLSRLIADRS